MWFLKDINLVIIYSITVFKNWHSHGWRGVRWDKLTVFEVGTVDGLAKETAILWRLLGDHTTSTNEIRGLTVRLKLRLLLVYSITILLYLRQLKTTLRRYMLILFYHQRYHLRPDLLTLFIPDLNSGENTLRIL
jgi:hypothetical protein